MGLLDNQTQQAYYTGTGFGGYQFISIDDIINNFLFSNTGEDTLIPKIKKLLNKHNTLLYSVPYQHFTNSIENYFNMIKFRLQKLDGLTYKELKTNINNVIKDIPKEKWEYN